MGAMRSDFLEGMKKTAYKYFDQGEFYADYKPVYPQLFAIEQSSAAYEKGTSIIGAGELDEVAEGAGFPEENLVEGWTTIGKNRSFKKKITMSAETLEDHQRIENLIKTSAKRWGLKWPESKDTMAAKVFNKGGLAAGHDIFDNSLPKMPDSSGLKLYDAFAMFNLTGNARSSKGTGTYYNHLGALGLSGTNLQTMLTLMEVTNAFDERDEIVTIETDVLLIPKNLKFSARVILKSTLKPGTTNNDINVLENILELIEWRKLDDSDGWTVGCKKKGIVFQERKGAKLNFFEDETTGNGVVTIFARAGIRIDNWRFWAQSNTTTT